MGGADGRGGSERASGTVAEGATGVGVTERLVRGFAVEAGAAALRVEEAMARNEPLIGGGVPIHLVKPDWARFAFPGETKAAE